MKEQGASSSQEEGAVSAPWWRAPSRRAKQVFAAAGAAVALLVGLVTLLDWTGEKLADPLPPAIDAQVETVALQLANVRRGDFMDEVGQSKEGFTPAELAEKGARFLVRVHILGMQGAELVLRYQVYRATNNQQPAGIIYDQIATDLKPRNQNDANSFPVWVPYPFRAGDYLLKLSIRSADGERLVGDSELFPFTVTKQELQ